uniref:Deoxyhypusine synthase n=2 Tax=Clastoptera arizonana TaxID=38151 RepID=A0A1B6EFG6_9HEMI
MANQTLGNKIKEDDVAEDKLKKIKENVLVKSITLPTQTSIIKGYDFNNGIDHKALLSTYYQCGFQATNFGIAVDEIKKMLHCRDLPLPEDMNDSLEDDLFIQRKYNCTIFLGYTSNMVSSGIRETIRFLVEHRLVDCLVTTAGGVEEDLIKCFAPTYLGDFNLDGRDLREKGLNRIGNLIVPNLNYCVFEDWIMPQLDKMLEEQNTKF